MPSLGILCSVGGTSNPSTFSHSDNSFSESDVKSHVLSATDVCTFDVVLEPSPKANNSDTFILLTSGANKTFISSLSMFTLPVEASAIFIFDFILDLLLFNAFFFFPPVLVDSVAFSLHSTDGVWGDLTSESPSKSQSSESLKHVTPVKILFSIAVKSDNSNSFFSENLSKSKDDKDGAQTNSSELLSDDSTFGCTLFRGAFCFKLSADLESSVSVFTPNFRLFPVIKVDAAFSPCCTSPLSDDELLFVDFRNIILIRTFLT